MYRTILSPLYLFYASMLALNLFVLSVGAVDPEKASGESIPAQEQVLILEATSAEDFSAEDIYRIELNLDIPGDIEIIAMESEVIGVTLATQTQATKTARDVLIRNYLENISVTGTQTTGMLQLKVKLPKADATTEKPNPFPDIADLHTTLQKQLQLKCTIKTPPDVSVKIQAKTGDIHLKRIRGKIEIAAETGNVKLEETLGNYNVTLKKGRIDGKILLTHGQNKLETQNGSIALTILDTVAAPMDVTAQGGGIRLELPENYAVDVELDSEKQQIVINLPTQIDNDTSLTLINDGGPLFRLKTTHAISLLHSSPNDENTSSDVPSDPLEDSIQPVPETTQPPVVDGNLFEIVWQKAALLSPFQNADGTGDPQNPTETFLMSDAENLYIGIKAYLAESQLPHISQTQRDSPIWEDECIEILVDPNLQTDIYYHFVINPIGAFFDQKVNVPGQPDFRFAPHDVQRILDRKSMQTAFNADSKWNSGAKVATQINTTFWSIEVAIPREMLETLSKSDLQDNPALENRWFFNIHRKAYSNAANMEDLAPTTQREYSYWLPTYDSEYPWWPHAPHEYVDILSERYAPAMGVLGFVKASPAFSETFTSEEKFRVATIEIEGNTSIETVVIQHYLPIQPGDVITGSQLSWLIAELRNHDWFQDVRLETRQEQPATAEPGISPGVSVHIKVTEAPVVLARKVKIDGNRSFPSQFIAEWFQLKPGYFAVDAAKRKQQLIADFYSNRGYEFATVTQKLVNGTLEFSIDEGTLHEIRFTGNTRISRAELLSALNLKTEDIGEKQSSQTPDIYRHALGRSKINSMDKKLRESSEHFKSVREWRVQREGGKNIMIVEIEEQPIVQPGGFPIIQFNRVHGVMLGAGGTLATQLTGKEQLFGSISRGFSSKIWNYHAGIEKGFFKRQPLKLGGSFYKLTDVSSNPYLHHGDASLGAAYYGSAFQDYYERWGSQGWITYAPSEWSYLRLEFTGEQHGNLSKSTDWSYLNRNLIKRGNARIDRGQLRNLTLAFAFDTRDHRSTSIQDFHTLFSTNERTRRGWRGQFAVEMTGQRFGGDYDFNFYRFEIARYTPLLKSHNLNVRIAGDFSDAPLPRQRLLHLGGGNTLRGYDFNRFTGDSRLLLNVEYRFIKETIYKDPDVVLGWTLSCFLDTGSIWWHGDAPFSDFQTFTTQLKTSIGVGCSVFIDPFGTLAPWTVGVEVAGPLDISFSSLRNPKILLRLDRIF
ncbi:MAG: BamA/TamA family outer membrane protein [Candidatus Poribacteria bacterium]|nr:BamA/TamA family outer membrane protein [Candidatus Poribacteria bacterium]